MRKLFCLLFGHIYEFQKPVDLELSLDSYYKCKTCGKERVGNIFMKGIR